MTFSTLLQHLPALKTQVIEQFEAHKKMAPAERTPFLNPTEQLEKNPNLSAVLALLYPKNEKTHIVLIKRAEYPGVHSAQISFPGGKWEDVDKDLQTTALRETEEEIGVKSEKIEIIKKLSEVYVPPSNFLVSPFLGISNKELSFAPEPNEVESVIEMPLSELLKQENVMKVKTETSYGSNIEVPAFVYEENVIWGATAMVLSELKETLLKIRL